MTSYSPQSVPVPDRYISRLRHSQSGTTRKGVKDLSLRAIQISCTLFHPFHRLSLPLFSFWMSFSFFLFIYISLSSLFTSSGACFCLLPPSYPLSFSFQFLSSPHNSRFHVFFPPLTIFSLSTHVRLDIFSHECAP